METPNLWSLNSPDKFWLCRSPISEDAWQEATQEAESLLGLPKNGGNFSNILEMVLGERRFGVSRWELGFFKRLYYLLKPALPRILTKLLRQFYGKPSKRKGDANWPIDPRYVLFQKELLRQFLLITGKESIEYTRFWPNNCRFALVLTHDIETAEGQRFVRKVADMEERLGFRSSFNFVLERYAIDFDLVKELRERGFEVGCHGLKHDGKLFSSKAEFDRRVAKINALIKKYGMTGFRSPLTHRNPEWMQSLKIEYDTSFFDTDPFEPMPGGTMSIWPFFIGHFVELPYTLVQDYTLTSILGEKTPRIWLDKVDFIEEYQGMALLNSHPDYLKEKNTWDVYCDFLISMKQRDNYWHALPTQVASWWRSRTVNWQKNT
ncbi:polysaccharide deacetylase family protein, partial [Candidatus Peregrinibacteria bacterium]|nr:polysaccharide deacetylase family protein [Candidatus Peregrinibacteria bacterium]